MASFCSIQPQPRVQPHCFLWQRRGFFLLLSLLLTQADWSLMGVPVFKRASSALIERMHMASFSSANRNLSSICWGLLDLPACVAERQRGGCGGLFLPEWTFWPWCRDLPSQLGLWSPRVDTLSQASQASQKDFYGHRFSSIPRSVSTMASHLYSGATISSTAP